MAKILVIEDESLIRDEVIDWLRFEGYEVVGAENGQLGLEAAYHETPDLIISDIAMPVMDGHEVLIEIRSSSHFDHVPFIFLTASADRDSIRKGMDMGADDYLTKPFTHSEVLNMVRTRLGKKAALDAQIQSQMGWFNAALDEEREKRLLKTRLVAMFSHDFRNPLTTILSSSNILRSYDNRLSLEQKKTQLNRIDASVHLLVQMLEDMLMVAQMESGSLVFSPQPIRLAEFVAGIVDEFRLISEGSHTLTLQADVTEPIEADPKLLRQILANLMSNALKYSPDETEVRVSVRRQDNHLTFAIEDQGIGIPEVALSHLFEPFHRASNATSVKGTGLGLTIVKQAAELHGGSIAVESQQDIGTRVIVTLPFKPAEL